MKSKQFALLSAGALLMLSGCYERGKVVPPSPKEIKKKKKEAIVYDFPVLKLSAKSNVSELSETNTTQKHVIKKSNTVEVENTSTNLRFPQIASKPKKTTTETIKKDALKIVIAQTKILQQENQSKIVPSTQPKVKVNKEVKNNPIQKRKPRKSVSLSQIPILSSIINSDISLQDIPILNKIIPKPSETSKGRIKKNVTRQKYTIQNTSRNNSNATIPTLDNTPSNGITRFSGGTSARGLDMAKIRIETDNYQTNIVLDSYLWVQYNNLPTDTSSVSGTYFFKYEAHNNRIVGHIKGYKTFSALLTKQDEMIKTNPIIKDIYIDRYVGDDGIKFIIELKKKVKVNVIDVEDPGSIIIELYPLKPQI